MCNRLEDRVDRAGRAADAVSEDALSLVDELSKLQASLKRSQVSEAVSKPLQADLLQTLEAAHALLTMPIASGPSGPVKAEPETLLSIDALDSATVNDVYANTTTLQPTTRKWQDTASLVLCFGGLLQPQTGIMVWAGTSIFLAMTLLFISARSFFTWAPEEGQGEDES